MSKNFNNLIEALEERSAALRAENEADLLWVLLDDAADALKLVSGQRHLDRLLSHGTADRLTETLDRLVFINNVLDHDDNVSLQWIYTEIENLLSGSPYNDQN
jgi:hypothetical protein